MIKQNNSFVQRYQNALRQAKASSLVTNTQPVSQVDMYHGVRAGVQIAFDRVFRGYRFTDDECAALVAGDRIEVHNLQGTRGVYAVEGKLNYNSLLQKYRFETENVIPNNPEYVFQKGVGQGIYRSAEVMESIHLSDDDLKGISFHEQDLRLGVMPEKECPSKIRDIFREVQNMPEMTRIVNSGLEIERDIVVEDIMEEPLIVKSEVLDQMDEMNGLDRKHEDLTRMPMSHTETIQHQMKQGDTFEFSDTPVVDNDLLYDDDFGEEEDPFVIVEDVDPYPYGESDMFNDDLDFDDTVSESEDFKTTMQELSDNKDNNDKLSEDKRSKQESVRNRSAMMNITMKMTMRWII